MTLKIIGIGFGRTGTLSLQHALNELGFPCYHMLEVLENKKNKSHIDFWYHVANAPAGQQYNWNDVFSKYTATVDYPAASVWKELIEAHPNAKVVLTLHPKGPETWYESAYQTIYQPQYLWQFKLLRLIPKVKKMTDMTRLLIWERSLKGTMTNKAAAIARYREHIEEVKSVVPKEKLLIFSVDQGWKPLCQFLNVAIPQKEFPNVNDRAAIRKTIRRVSALAYVLLVTTVVLITSVAFAIKWFLFP